ncbi:hypothetical protein MUY35_06170 [Aliiroseovarius sp. S1339]|uniref:hypothetical protein n=1 Tax=Aliiroseovarius sp. S1339 TaxID=2936990 RepID=UPI0020BE2BCE|nr:hypothetical protein [Aliiroseovarius sp. S1339]MCK8463432.1 hypothetical protein [Aliiroseovarius sp. S1339]
MNTQTPQQSTPLRWSKPIAVLALIFGVMTVFSGGNVLFGPAEARDMAGNYIGFVVWFNFLAGFAYIAAAVGLWLGKGWAIRLAGLIAAATAIAILGFILAILSGSAFEMRTVGALALRFSFWTAIALVMRRGVKQP